jgi:hypothetical protein
VDGGEEVHHELEAHPAHDHEHQDHDTIHGLDGSTTTVSADGATTQVSADGKTVISINPDGSTTRMDPDGTITTTGVGGIPVGGTPQIISHPDGSTETKNSNGAVTTVSADGATIATILRRSGNSVEHSHGVTSDLLTAQFASGDQVRIDGQIALVAKSTTWGGDRIQVRMHDGTIRSYPPAELEKHHERSTKGNSTKGNSMRGNSMRGNSRFGSPGQVEDGFSTTSMENTARSNRGGETRGSGNTSRAGWGALISPIKRTPPRPKQRQSTWMADMMQLGRHQPIDPLGRHQPIDPLRQLQSEPWDRQDGCAGGGSGGHQRNDRGNEGSRDLNASARTARVGIRGQPRGNSGAREMRQGTSKWGDSAKMFTGFEAAPVILETQGRFFIYRDASGLFQKRLTTRQSLSTNTH